MWLDSLSITRLRLIFTSKQQYTVCVYVCMLICMSVYCKHVTPWDTYCLRGWPGRSPGRRRPVSRAADSWGAGSDWGTPLWVSGSHLKHHLKRRGHNDTQEEVGGITRDKTNKETRQKRTFNGTKRQAGSNESEGLPQGGRAAWCQLTQSCMPCKAKAHSVLPQSTGGRENRQTQYG